MAYNQVFSGSVTSAANVGPASAVNGFRLLVGAVEFLNTTAAVAYIQLFPVPASAVTLGTTVPTLSFGLPASGGMTLNFGSKGWRFGGTGLSIAATTTRTGSTTAGVDVNVIYE